MKSCCTDTFIRTFEEVIGFLEQKHITSIEDVIGVLKGSVRMLRDADDAAIQRHQKRIKRLQEDLDRCAVHYKDKE